MTDFFTKDDLLTVATLHDDDASLREELLMTTALAHSDGQVLWGPGTEGPREFSRADYAPTASATARTANTIAAPSAGAGQPAIAPSFTPNDPLFANQWHFGFMPLIDVIWDEFTGAGIAAAVVDDGMLFTHPDLTNNYDASLHVTVNGSLLVPDQLGPHGTSVAGLIAAEADNGQGVVGVSHGASLTGVQIFGGPADVNSNPAEFLQAVQQLDNFDVSNHSWGSYNGFGNFSPAFNQTYINEYFTLLEFGRGGLGSIQVQAAGNNGLTANGDFTNTSRATITVGAMDSDGDIASYSNDGAALLLTAPTSGFGAGNLDQVTTDLLGGSGYNVGDYTDTANGFGGTSGATPIVTGVVALMLDANEDLGWRDVQTILANTSFLVGSQFGLGSAGDEEYVWTANGATNWNGGGNLYSGDYGYGSVNAFGAVRMAEVWSLFDAPQVTNNEDSFFNSYNPGGLAIADLTTTSFTFSVAPSFEFELEYVEVTIELTHTFLPALDIEIISPDGTTISIMPAFEGQSDIAGSGWEWTFGMNNLRGELAAGTWTVNITDVDGFGDTGTFTRIDLAGYGRNEASAGVNLDDDVYHYTGDIFAALSLDPTRQTINDTSGTDWLNLAAIGVGDLSVDMRQGLTSTFSGIDFLTIGLGTDIENAVLGDGNDTLAGNDLDNLIYGMRGDDNMDGLGGNDGMWGGTGNDVLVGATGNDRLDGEEGDDLLSGGDGTDLLTGGVGADGLDGGAGFDSALYNQSDAAVQVDLLAGTGVGGHAQGDTYNGIERVIGSGFDDLIRGDAGSNRLEGRNGDDTIEGGDGNDQLIGGKGADMMDGGAGLDAAFYNLSSAGVTIDTVTNINSGGDAAGDMLTNIERIVGSAFSDTLTGGSGTIWLEGGEGDDVLVGGSANDLLFGEEGNDNIDGGAGRDAIYFVRASSGAIADLSTNAITDDGQGGSDVIVNVENIVGSASSDLFRGDAAINNIRGEDGNDIISGGAGDDILRGGSGNDVFLQEIGAEKERVRDFEDGLDQFDVQAHGLTAAAAVGLATTFGTSVLLNFGGGDRLIIENTVLADIDTGDFIGV